MKRPVAVALAAGPAGLILAALLACTPVHGGHGHTPTPKPYPTCSASSERHCTPGTSTARPPKPSYSQPSVGAPSTPCKTAPTTPVIVPSTPATQTPVASSPAAPPVSSSPVVPPAARLTPPVPARGGPPPVPVSPPLANTGAPIKTLIGVAVALLAGGLSLVGLTLGAGRRP